jgi:hypothetical protein
MRLLGSWLTLRALKKCAQSQYFGSVSQKQDAAAVNPDAATRSAAD